MLFVLISITAIVALAAGARAAWALHSLWRAVPRSNADFGMD